MLNFETEKRKDALWIKSFGVMRVVIMALIAVLLLVDIVGIGIKWWIVLVHPTLLSTDYHMILGDLFSALVLYELIVLTKVISPLHLLDLALTLIIRELMLTDGGKGTLTYIVSFAILFLVRLLWNRFSKVEHDQMME